MLKVLHRLATIVRRVMGGNIKIVFQIDSAGHHLTTMVLQQAARLNIILLLIPGLLTWLLQPLDVFVFGRLKNDFRNSLFLEKRRQPNGLLPHNAWIRCLRGSIQNFLVDRTWSDTFARVGLSDNTQHLTALCTLFLAAPDTVQPRELTAQELDTVIGRHRVGIQRLCFSTASRERVARLQPIPAPLPPHLEDYELPLED